MREMERANIVTTPENMAIYLKKCTRKWDLFGTRNSEINLEEIYKNLILKSIRNLF